MTKTADLLGPVTFWWFPDEEPPLVEYLLADGIDRAFVGDRARNRAAVLPQDLREAMATTAEHLLIGPPALIDQVTVRELEDDTGSLYVIAMRASPLLSYRRPKLTSSKRLTSGNLYAYKGHFEGDTYVDKPDEFVDWVKRVLAFVRKATPERHRYKSYRITKRVAEAIRNDGLELEDG